MNYVTEEEADGWIKNHKIAYSTFHEWSQEIAHLTEVRGWSRNQQGRHRWCAEDNAKASGSSPARSGVNHQIQGFAADMTKLALKKIMKFSEENPGLFYICALVHDEIILMVRGNMILDESKYKFENGILKPAWKIVGQGTEVILECKRLMEEAEHELFGGQWLGRSEYDISPYWSH